MRKKLQKNEKFKIKYQSQMFNLDSDADTDHNIYKNQELYCIQDMFSTVGLDGWLHNCSQSSAPFRSSALGDLT